MNDFDKRQRINELKELIYQKKKEKDYAKAMQLALKLTLNGTYGAFANKHFVCSNGDIANAITAHGRDINQFMMFNIEQYFYKSWHDDKEKHKILGKEYICEVNGKYAAYTVEFNRIEWEFESLEKLIKHKNIEITDLIPVDIQHGDIQAKYLYVLHDFESVQMLDEKPRWGEYEGRPKYMGDNQIVVYGDTDSLYVTLTPMMKSMGFDPLGDEDKVKNFILHFDALVIKPVFNEFLEVYANRYKVKNLHDFELETISKSALFLKKKHYLNNIVWEDGVHYKSLSYYYPKGIEIIRSSTPPFVRRNIYRIIDYLFGDPNANVQEVMRIVKQIKKEFELADIEDISMTSSCSNYMSKVLDDTQGVNCVKGAHFGVKAACFHNYLLNKNSEYKKRYDMIKSGRIKYYYCTHRTNEIFAYLRSFHPTELTEKEKVKIDIDMQFEKAFLGIVNKFIKPMGMSPITKRISVLTSLFSFDDTNDDDDDDELDDWDFLK